ncbi:hypothetical protein, partial [Nonomuraea sp. NPDC049141]|uniref:hypothetical protein n=1 Tax=Nonomuraea sp. NPDC049141 TaxID=3155500 RepID=UPI0033D88543
MNQPQLLLRHVKRPPVKAGTLALAITIVLAAVFATLMALPSPAMASPATTRLSPTDPSTAQTSATTSSPTPTPSASDQRKGEVGVLFNCGDYTNQPMTRSQALVRAQSWITARVPYSQSACHSNQYGSYRTDCSGFISMAWGLSRSYTTFDIHLVSHTIARADLKPGDALNDVDSHIALFVRWDDAQQTKPVVREQAGPDGSPTIERVWSAAYASGYTPIRYNNIRDDAPPAPAGVRSVVTANGSQLFGIGSDGHVMSTFWSPSISTNGGWHEWFAIPTGFADGKTALNATVSFTTINGQIQLFTIAPDGHVMSTFWSPSISTNGGWHEWFAIPTGFADGKS